MGKGKISPMLNVGKNTALSSPAMPQTMSATPQVKTFPKKSFLGLTATMLTIGCIIVFFSLLSLGVGKYYAHKCENQMGMMDYVFDDMEPEDMEFMEPRDPDMGPDEDRPPKEPGMKPRPEGEMDHKPRGEPLRRPGHEESHEEEFGDDFDRRHERRPHKGGRHSREGHDDDNDDDDWRGPHKYAEDCMMIDEEVLTFFFGAWAYYLGYGVFIIVTGALGVGAARSDVSHRKSGLKFGFLGMCLFNILFLGLITMSASMWDLALYGGDDLMGSGFRKFNRVLIMMSSLILWILSIVASSFACCCTPVEEYKSVPVVYQPQPTAWNVPQAPMYQTLPPIGEPMAKAGALPPLDVEPKKVLLDTQGY